MEIFNMSDLSIALQSTETLQTFPFKDTFLDSVAANPSDVFSKQNRPGKLKFYLSALNLKIPFSLTNK